MARSSCQLRADAVGLLLIMGAATVTTGRPHATITIMAAVVRTPCTLPPTTLIRVPATVVWGTPCVWFAPFSNRLLSSRARLRFGSLCKVRCFHLSSHRLFDAILYNVTNHFRQHYPFFLGNVACTMDFNNIVFPSFRSNVG